MWYQLVPFLIYAATIQAADRTVYRNCSQIELCNQNRELIAKDRWKVLLETLSYVQGIVSFRVQSIEDSTSFVFLNISAIKGGIFRIQIEEPDSTRYHIEHVLDHNPEIIKWVHTLKNSNNLKF